MNQSGNRLLRAFHLIKYIGAHPGMEEYEKQKLGIFNVLNFFGLMSGLIIPLAGLFNNDHMPVMAWLVATAPFAISFLVLLGNYRQQFEQARICYFIFYPLITALVYTTGIDVGIQLFFVLYGLLSVFFLRKLVHAIVSFSLSMLFYFVVSVLDHPYEVYLKNSNYSFYIFNNALAVVFIFYSLYLIKKESSRYQFNLLRANRELNARNREIESQRRDISEKAAQLETQTRQLSELNTLKSKLFSIIAHDLRGPLYALRNLFNNMQQLDIPAQEVKAMIPDVQKDLTYTTGLMENLLQWAKSQMESESVNLRVIDLSELIANVTRLVKLQAESKKVYLETVTNSPVYVYADSDMIDLVLRNILTNAIKFTPSHGHIRVELNHSGSFVEVSVADSGRGMSAAALQKIREKSYYSTRGTANEGGTGLGLMLCQEFLVRNGGRLHIDSEEGKGSVFSFTLPSTR